MLENPTVNIKIKLSTLWIATTFCYLYGDYFELYTPEKIDGMIAGDNVLGSPIALLIASLVMAIPPLMIVLSLTLKPIISKWLNIVVGLLFTLMMVVIASLSFTPWYSFYVFLGVLEAILTAIIVWTAFNWKKVSESTTQL